MSEAKQDNWVALQEKVITFVNERNGSAFPRPSKGNEAILAGVFDNSYTDEDGNTLSSKVVLKELLADTSVKTELTLNINKAEWHYIITFDKGDYITAATEVPPVLAKDTAKDTAKKLYDAIDLDVIAEVIAEKDITDPSVDRVITDPSVDGELTDPGVDGDRADITDPSVDRIALTHEGIQGMTSEEVVAYVLQETGQDLSDVEGRGELMKQADDILDQKVTDDATDGPGA